MLKTRLEWWAESCDILDNHQFGFRKGRSTTDVLGTIAGHILAGFAARQYTAAVFADVEGAYDNVHPRLLLSKLWGKGVPLKILGVLTALLTQRNLYATYERRMIGPRRAFIGLAQGSVLSPLLYLLYTSDISSNMPRGVVSLKFADDETLLVRGPSLQDVLQRLQGGLEVLAENLGENGIPCPRQNPLCASSPGED